MPTPTYTPLATITLTASASAVTFSSIPGTYRHLVIAMESKGTATTNGFIRTNGQAGTQSYGWAQLAGTGTQFLPQSSASSSSVPLTVSANATTTSALVSQIEIMDYNRANKFGTFLVKSNSPAATEIIFGRTRTQSNIPITSVQISGAWAAGGIFSLYGIAG